MSDNELPEIVWLAGKPWIFGSHIPTGSTVRYRQPGGPVFVKVTELEGPPWPIELVAWPDGSAPVAADGDNR